MIGNPSAQQLSTTQNLEVFFIFQLIKMRSKFILERDSLFTRFTSVRYDLLSVVQAIKLIKVYLTPPYTYNKKSFVFSSLYRFGFSLESCWRTYQYVSTCFLVLSVIRIENKKIGFQEGQIQYINSTFDINVNPQKSF